MRILLAASVVLVVLGGCARRGDRNNMETGARQSSDTMVMKRTMEDTAIVRHDTTVSTDTLHKRGTKPLKTDTVKKH